jgi:hypothetical protein
MQERSAPRSSFLGVALLLTGACWLVEPLDHLPVSHDASAADAPASTCENCQGCCNNGTCETEISSEACGSNGERCTNCGTVGGGCTALNGSYSCACGNSMGCTSPATCSNYVCCFPSGTAADASNPQYCCSGVVSGGTCT